MTDRAPARSLPRHLSLQLTRRLCLGLAVAGAGAATGWIAGCTLPEPPPVDPAALQSLELEGAAGTRYQRLPQLPSDEYFLNPNDRNDPRNYDPVSRIEAEVARGTDVSIGQIGLRVPTSRPTTGPATQPADEQVLYLPLQECVRRATLNNFNVAVAGYAPAISETRVTEALARFDPTFRTAAEYQDQVGVNVAENVFGDTERLTLSTGLSQLLPSGGNVELEYRALRNDSDQTSIFSPIPAGVSWTSDLSLQLTQPLLRDFGYDINRARIYVNRNDQRISVLEFRRELEEILLQVEQTYWQLYRAQLEVEIQTELLDRTQETADRIAKRRVRDATRAEISQALSAVSLRRQDLIQAKGAVAQLSDQLKQLINDPTLPIGGETLVLPATEPVMVPLLFDQQEALAVALVNRPELSQQILRIVNSGRVLSVAESNRLPRLDLLLSGGFGGFDEDFGEAVSQQLSSTTSRSARVCSSRSRLATGRRGRCCVDRGWSVSAR